MSSAGIRPGNVRPLPPSQPLRRTGDESGAGSTGSGEGPRREGPGGSRRPLPSVAPTSPQPQARRTTGAPSPGPPEAKTQRPEKRYTPDELMAMMRSGQLGGQTPGAGPPRAGAPGARPGLGPRPGGPAVGPPPPRPGGPQPPGARRPPAGSAAPPAAPVVVPINEEEEDRKGKAAGRLGTPADRAGRRARRNERANERRVTSPMPAAALLSETEEDGRRTRSGRKSHKLGQRLATVSPRKSHAQIEPPITLRGLSEVIGVRANDLIKRIMTSLGQFVTINATLDEETALMLALEFGVELEVVHERTAEDDMLESFEPQAVAEENLRPRPPVITILGHVDHGKTSLLDRIRKSNVVSTESGGITQHIGAYQVEHDGKQITFVDTPGHEAFTAMRARGANVTDIVVLVVAADDGVMPQTQEAIAHAKAADVPIVVALNKIDLPNVNLNKIYGELSQQELAPEEYGGDTPVIKTSALTGQGIAELLEMLGIVAELRCELKADPSRQATGTCLEASISCSRFQQTAYEHCL